MPGLFIDGTCPCQTSELYDYVIVQYDNPADCAGEFIQTYGMWVLSAYQFDNFDKFDAAFSLSRTKVWKRIKAFTIAEAFNLIEANAGSDKAPKHRILDFDESTGIFREFRHCTYISKSSIPKVGEDEKAAIIARMQARIAALRKGTNA